MLKSLTDDALHIGSIERPPNLRVIGQRPCDKAVLPDPNAPTWTYVSPAVATFTDVSDGPIDAKRIPMLSMVEDGKHTSSADLATGQSAHQAPLSVSFLVLWGQCE